MTLGFGYILATMLQNVEEPELEFQDYKSIDEDIDLMNDETFGQTSLETNWEEEHERYTASTLVTTQVREFGVKRFFSKVATENEDVQ